MFYGFSYLAEFGVFWVVLMSGNKMDFKEFFSPLKKLASSSLF